MKSLKVEFYLYVPDRVTAADIARTMSGAYSTSHDLAENLAEELTVAGIINKEEIPLVKFSGNTW